MKHQVEWLTPAPLWNLALADGGERTRFRAPSLLRFDSDSFMDDLAGVLADAPEKLADRVARPEHWERPEAGWVEAGDASLEAVLKLFQPAQSRFYLVAASLVCARTGLPERKVDVAAEERVAMVVRRLVPVTGAVFDPADAETYTEHVWLGDRESGRWEAATVAEKVMEGEERLALFPMSFQYEGRARRIHVGNLPVAGRELYETRGPASVEPAPLVTAGNDPMLPLADPRKAVWVDGPQEALGLYAGTKDPGAGGAGKEMQDEDARELLLFTLLDMVDLFQGELPELWDAIDDESSAGLAAGSAARQVYDALAGSVAPGISWREALRRTDAQRESLLLGQDPPPGTSPPLPDPYDRASIAIAASALLVGQSIGDKVFDALDEAGPPGETAPGGAATATAEAAARTEEEGAFYVARCVYERPRCAKYVDPVVSAPSRPFRLAAFFDPDAPARPVTIRMPVDTSIRGLSKFPKGVAMVVSNKLRQQVEHLQNATLEQIDDGDLEDSPPSWGIGMLCSLSIPIITLCAFIVLMIFIQLLNIVFWWLPFLRICLPIPVRND